MMRFKNKTAIVTGAAHGIGKAVALRLGREGARVMVSDAGHVLAADGGFTIAGVMEG